MKTKIISAYKTEAKQVIVITHGESFIYPKKLWGDKSDLLLDRVKTVGYIETDKWRMI